MSAEIPIDPTLSPEYIARMDAYWRVAHLRQRLRDKLVEHREYIREHGDDLPEIKQWKWKER